MLCILPYLQSVRTSTEPLLTDKFLRSPLKGCLFLCYRCSKVPNLPQNKACDPVSHAHALDNTSPITMISRALSQAALMKLRPLCAIVQLLFTRSILQPALLAAKYFSLPQMNPSASCAGIIHPGRTPLLHLATPAHISPTCIPPGMTKPTSCPSIRTLIYKGNARIWVTQGSLTAHHLPGL